MKSRFVGKLTEFAVIAKGWESLREGVDVLRLWGESDAGASVTLLRYKPGAQVPRHRHSGFEAIFVISGSQSDERGTYGPGAFVVNPDGDEHSVRSEEGCLVLILWERPVVFV